MNRTIKGLLLSVFCIGGVLTYCGANENAEFQFKIPAIEEQRIPVLYTCDGNNISPALFWSGQPSGTKSYAIICMDKDAVNESPGTSFIHWLIYNINPRLNHFNDAIPHDSKLANRAFQGRNSFRRIGYDGPCPPQNNEHHYTFTLYALDAMLDIRAGANYEELNKAMKGHILGQIEVQGTYESKRAVNKELPIALNRPDVIMERSKRGSLN